MGSKKKPPKIQGGTKAKVTGNYYQNGRLVSSSLYDPKTRTYTNSVNQSPDEQALTTQSNQGLLSLIPKINQTLDTSPEAKQQYADAFYQPALRAINQQAQYATDEANTRFSQTGLGNSVGYGRYTADRIANKAMGQAADAKANSIIQGEQLPGIRLTPLLQAAGLYSGISGDMNARQYQQLNPAFQGQQIGFNQRQQLYQNDRQNWQDNGSQRGNWYTRFIDPLNTMGMNGSSSGGGGGSDYLGTVLSLAGAGIGAAYGGPVGMQAGATLGGMAGNQLSGSKYGSQATLPANFSYKL